MGAEVVHEHHGVVMSEPLIRIRNHHSAACGDPPIVSDEDPDIDIGYFENRHGEQRLFTCHRKTRKVELRGGDIDWNTVHKVENGTAEGLILNAESVPGSRPAGVPRSPGDDYGLPETP